MAHRSRSSDQYISDWNGIDLRGGTAASAVVLIPLLFLTSIDLCGQSFNETFCLGTILEVILDMSNCTVFSIQVCAVFVADFGIKCMVPFRISGIDRYSLRYSKQTDEIPIFVAGMRHRLGRVFPTFCEVKIFSSICFSFVFFPM